MCCVRRCDLKHAKNKSSQRGSSTVGLTQETLFCHEPSSSLQTFCFLFRAPVNTRVPYFQTNDHGSSFFRLHSNWIASAVVISSQEYSSCFTSDFTPSPYLISRQRRRGTTALRRRLPLLKQNGDKSELIRGRSLFAKNLLL